MSISEHAGLSGNTFQRSIYHPSYALCDTPYINRYCFSTEVPSSGSHYNPGTYRQRASPGYAPAIAIAIDCNNVNGVNNMKLSVACRS